MHFGLVGPGGEIVGGGYARVPLAACSWREDPDGRSSLMITWPEAEREWSVEGVGFFAEAGGGKPFFVWSFCEHWGVVAVAAGTTLSIGLPPGMVG